MKQFFFEMRRVMEKFGDLVLSKIIPARRATLKTEAHKRELEAERLDRLRNPGDYRGS